MSFRSTTSPLLLDLPSAPRLTAGTSGIPSSLGVTGGEYKGQGQIHRAVADTRLLAIPASWGRIADPNPY